MHSDSTSNSEEIGPSPRGTPPMFSDQVAPLEPLPPRPTNTLGIDAFVLSLSGTTCLPFVGGIAGFVCGIIAVRRKPRGFAIAAISISGLTSCIGVPLFIALFLPALASGRSAARLVKTRVAATDVEMRVDAFRAANDGRWPTDVLECYGVESPPMDGWGTPLRFVIEHPDAERVDQPAMHASADPKYFVWSAGADMIWDTEDDWVVSDSPIGAAEAAGYRTEPSMR